MESISTNELDFCHHGRHSKTPRCVCRLMNGREPLRKTAMMVASPRNQSLSSCYLANLKVYKIQ